jgi:hypothetical protein
MMNQSAVANRQPAVGAGNPTHKRGSHVVGPRPNARGTPKGSRHREQTTSSLNHELRTVNRKL